MRQSADLLDVSFSKRARYLTVREAEILAASLAWESPFHEIPHGTSNQS